MSISEESLSIFHDSFARCQVNRKFLSIFYEIFISADKSVLEKFEGVDMERQKNMLLRSLSMIMLSSQGDGAADVYLGRVARRHAKKDLDVGPDLYQLWLDSLLEAVEQVDPQFSPQVKQSWEEVMSYGIDYMVSRYED